MPQDVTSIYSQMDKFVIVGGRSMAGVPFPLPFLDVIKCINYTQI